MHCTRTTGIRHITRLGMPPSQCIQSVSVKWIEYSIARCPDAEAPDQNSRRPRSKEKAGFEVITPAHARKVPYPLPRTPCGQILLLYCTEALFYTLRWTVNLVKIFTCIMRYYLGLRDFSRTAAMLSLCDLTMYRQKDMASTM